MSQPRGLRCETLKPGHSVFDRAETRLIATAPSALEAAAEIARAEGVEPVILGSAIEGEAAEVGRFMAGMRQAFGPAWPTC